MKEIVSIFLYTLLALDHFKGTQSVPIRFEKFNFTVSNPSPIEFPIDEQDAKYLVPLDTLLLHVLLDQWRQMLLGILGEMLADRSMTIVDGQKLIVVQVMAMKVIVNAIGILIGLVGVLGVPTTLRTRRHSHCHGNPSVLLRQKRHVLPRMAHKTSRLFWRLVNQSIPTIFHLLTQFCLGHIRCIWVGLFGLGLGLGVVVGLSIFLLLLFWFMLLTERE